MLEVFFGTLLGIFILCVLVVVVAATFMVVTVTTTVMSTHRILRRGLSR